MMHFPATLQDNSHNDLTISVKLKVPDCFCREHHAPAANRLIDDYRAHHSIFPTVLEYVEHESGPELIFYAAALGVTKGIIELIVAILNARREGCKHGDCQHRPLAIIVRGVSSNGYFGERRVMEVALNSPPNSEIIEKALSEAIQVIAEDRVRHNQSA